MLHQRKLHVESLESREVPSNGISAVQSGAVVTVNGTNISDRITLSSSGGVLTVSTSNGAGSASWRFNDNSITEVRVYGYQGNDNINGASQANAMLVGAHQGNDTVNGGSGRDTIYGHSGVDLLYGNNGDDWVIGGDWAGSGFSTGATVAERDRLVGGSGLDQYRDEFNFNAPVVGGEDYRDIQQSESPVCQTLAALGASVRAGFRFADDISYQGNNRYFVRLYGGAQSQYVTFNGIWSDADPTPRDGNAEFWPILMQRARLQSLGIDPYVNRTIAQWNQLQNATGGRLYSSEDALRRFIGSASSYGMTQFDSGGLYSAWASGRAVTVSSFSSNSNAPNSNGVVGFHVYSLVGMYTDNRYGVIVQLYNPWGVDSSGNITVDVYSSDGVGRNDGIIHMPWNFFVSSTNFSGISITG